MRCTLATEREAAGRQRGCETRVERSRAVPDACVCAKFGRASGVRVKWGMELSSLALLIQSDLIDCSMNTCSTW